MKKNAFKTALIGCGRIGFLLENDPLRNKPCTHYGGAKAAGIKINYACDVDLKRALTFAKTADIPEKNIYKDYRQLVLEHKPDLVIIATWTSTHAEIGIFSAKNGAKTIICEKPVASNLQNAQSLMYECKKHKVNLIINHERRYDPRYRAVKRMLQSGRIGEIKTVHGSVLTSARAQKAITEEGGGPLLHDGTHIIDILRFFFGDIISVRGELKKRKYYFEDNAAAWLKTEGGIDIFLEAGGSRDYFLFELEIYGSMGKIIIGNGYQELFLSKKSKLYTGFSDLAQKKFPGINGINCFKKEYLEAINSIFNHADITSSGRDGYKALEAIHAIYLSSYLNGKTIDLPVKPDKVNLKKIFG